MYKRQTAKTENSGDVTWYSLDVEDIDTYFQSNILVHNIPPKCFVAGTPITMGDGTTKSIELVEVGDEIHNYDFDSKEIRRVMNTLLNSKRGDDAPTNLAHAEQSGINMSDFRNTFNTELNRLTAAVKKRFTNAAAKEGSGVKINGRTN